MIRKNKKYPIEEVLNKVIFDINRRVDIDGDLMKMTSDRLKLFKLKGTTCIKCGLEGKYFLKEKHLEGDKHYHFNLYGIENGSEVLFTKDHIVPVSLLGKNNLNNYQTMCVRCNLLKGNKGE